MGGPGSALVAHPSVCTGRPALGAGRSGMGGAKVAHAVGRRQAPVPRPGAALRHGCLPSATLITFQPAWVPVLPQARVLMEALCCGAVLGQLWEPGGSGACHEPPHGLPGEPVMPPCASMAAMMCGDARLEGLPAIAASAAPRFAAAHPPQPRACRARGACSCARRPRRSLARACTTLWP